MKRRTLIVLLLAITIPCSGFSADDKTLRKQRSEAQKQRQALKNERNKSIQSASREFRQFAKDLKKEYQEKSRDLDTEFRLQQIDLQAERNMQIATAEAEMQQKMTSMLLNIQSANQDTLVQIKDNMQAHTQQVFVIRKQSAQLEQDQKMENELARHQLMSERDQMALDKAEALGLRGKYSPILAEPIGDALTKQEETWNERELKTIEKLSATNQRLFAEYDYGTTLRKWEMANKQEDFKLLWLKKTELQAINHEQSFYNTLLFQSGNNTAEDQQEISRRIAEYSKQIQHTNIKYKKFADKNRVKRKEQKRKIMGR